ncbi:MAG: AI-2E family transporter [Halothiobacillaceae bacterium]|nr:AI-2E family transporter [Halothiobacillaceae bacterium]
MTDISRLFFLGGLGLGGVVLWLLSPVLTPFLVAALLAYLFDPWVDRLERRRVPRSLGVALVFLVIALGVSAALLWLAPMLQKQILALAQSLPAHLAWIQDTLIPRLTELTGLPLDMSALKTTLAAHAQEAGQWVARGLGLAFGSGMTLLSWLMNLLLVPVVTFYLLRDWDRLVSGVRGLLPRGVEPTVTQLARESDDVLGAFLRGQLSVMLALGVVYSTGLWMAGLELALLIGMIAGLVSFVPYLGFIVGIVSASLAMYFQTHEWLPLVYVLIVFGIGQLLESVLFTPLLVGDRIGLHPVAVIFSVMAGGQLFGFFGILLALPVAAVLAVIVRHMHGRYRQSAFYGAEPPAGPDAAVSVTMPVGEAEIDTVQGAPAAVPDAIPPVSER